MNLVTPDKILATPVSELADQSSVSLFRLKTDAADFLAAAKAIGARAAIVEPKLVKVAPSEANGTLLVFAQA